MRVYMGDVGGDRGSVGNLGSHSVRKHSRSHCTKQGSPDSDRPHVGEYQKGVHWHSRSVYRLSQTTLKQKSYYK